MSLTVLIPQQQIQHRIEFLSQQIVADYADCRNLTLICVLKGGAVFFADLIRQIPLAIRCEFIQLSSYGNSTEPSRQVEIVSSGFNDLSNCHVLVVEDIIDSGQSLCLLQNHLAKSDPLSLRVCTLLDKPSRRRVEIEADYVGFTIADQFVVGYGLDYAQQYRNLPDICVLETEED